MDGAGMSEPTTPNEPKKPPRRTKLAVATGRTSKDWRAQLEFDKHGRIKGTLVNVQLILVHDPAWAGVLAFDAFRSEVITTRAPAWDAISAPAGHVAGAERYEPWTELDDLRLVGWLDRSSYLVKASREVVSAAVQLVAQRREVHGPRDYLRGLTWDGVQRVEEWLVRYVGAEDTPYTRAVARAVLVGAVARAFDPGCKLDTMLVLEGSQGARKSTAVRALFAIEPTWFSDSTIDLASKDRFTALRGRWCIEWAELDGLTRHEAARVKAFVSSATDTYRPPYARGDVQVARSCVFVGTTNSDAYLQDATGNRRWWPVRVGRIDVDGIARDRDQLWAEAVALYLGGTAWWLDGSTEAMAREEQAERVTADPWQPIVDAYLLRHDTVTTADLLDALGIEPGRRTRADETRAGACLRMAGWTASRPRVAAGERRARIYSRPVQLVQPDGQGVGPEKTQ